MHKTKWGAGLLRNEIRGFASLRTRLGACATGRRRGSAGASPSRCGGNPCRELSFGSRLRERMGHLAERVAGVVARRPAVAAAVLLMLGISLHRVLPVYPWVWVIAGMAALVGAGISLQKPTVSSLLLAFAIVLGGCASAQIS